MDQPFDLVDDDIGLADRYLVSGTRCADVPTVWGLRCAVYMGGVRFPPHGIRHPIARPRQAAGDHRNRNIARFRRIGPRNVADPLVFGCGGFGGADDRAVYPFGHLVGERH